MRGNNGKQGVTGVTRGKGVTTGNRGNKGEQG